MEDDREVEEVILLLALGVKLYAKKLGKVTYHAAVFGFE